MITYEDKVALYENADIADINKVTAGDMNEIKQVVNSLANLFFPIGKIEMFYDDKDHSSYLGFKWTRVGQGRFPVGWNGSSSTETQFKTIGQTGGERNHTLTVEEMPSHSHKYSLAYNITGSAAGLAYGETAAGIFSDGFIKNTGDGQSHNNLPPYIVYAFWRRVS